MNMLKNTYDYPALDGDRVPHIRSRALLGQVMGYVAVTVGFAALGAYLGRNLSGGIGLLLLFAALAVVFGLHFAVVKGREQLAIWLLFGLGLLLGLSVASIANFAEADPPPSGSQSAPPQRSSAPWAHTATPPAETCRHGHDRCSGHCWA